MTVKSIVIEQSAEAILLGEHSEAGICASLVACWGTKASLVRPLAGAIHKQFHFSAYPNSAKVYLSEWLEESELFNRLYTENKLRIYRWPLERYQAKSPTPNQAKTRLQEQLSLPVISDLEDLAHWLSLDLSDLHWLACVYPCIKNHSKLGHYHYKELQQKNGKRRVLEIPKPRLKSVQQKVHQQILKHVPVHPAAHGFVTARSTSSFANMHVGKNVLVRLDIKDFFYSFSSDSVVSLFSALAYTKTVAKWLKGLIMTRCNESDIPYFIKPEEAQKLKREHLAQGAPSSPTLANLLMYRCDCRLAGLSRALGFEYSRYADDLAFSSDQLHAPVNQLISSAKEILNSHNMQLNTNKTKVLRQHTRQSLVGLVVNQKLTIGREEYKLFEAELFNCIRFGPQSQNRDDHKNYRDHLQGKLAHFIYIDPHKAKKLTYLFDQINW